MSDGNGSALAVIEQPTIPELSVSTLMRRATDVAGVCREIVVRTAQAIPGSDRKHVKVEGWESIAAAYGYAAGSGDVEPELREGKLVGFKAKGYLRRLSDGVVIAEAEGFVGEDEPLWAGGGHNKKTGKPFDRRPEYARRAMAQTRAISRVCRGAFAFVVTLIDNKLSTTPAEEMDGVTVEGTIDPPPPAPRGNAAVKAALRPSPPPAQQRTEEPPPHEDADFRPVGTPTHDRNFVMPFANKKNEPVGELSEKSLAWFRAALTENIANPEKARFRDAAQAQLVIIESEMKFRGL